LVLRESTQRGGVAGRGRGFSRRSPAGGVFIDEPGNEPVPADADRDAVRGGVHGLDLRGKYRSLRVTYEQWEQEQWGSDFHEGLGVINRGAGKAAIERRSRVTDPIPDHYGIANNLVSSYVDMALFGCAFAAMVVTCSHMSQALRRIYSLATRSTLSSIEAPMIMQRDRGLAVASLVLGLCATSTVSAQQSYSHRVGIEPRHSEHTLTPRSGLSREAADSVPTVDARAATYPLYGALIGAGVGFTVAFIGTHQAHIKDHSEDGLVYQILIPFGAGVGLIAGCVVYLVRRN
jgi:hypothetical protein